MKKKPARRSYTREFKLEEVRPIMEENRVLREHVGDRRLRITDAQRRRAEIAGIAPEPDGRWIKQRAAIWSRTIGVWPTS